MVYARKQEQEKGKRVRVPMGARRSRLQLSDKEAKALKDAGYVTRWVNDQDGRVERALSGGYVFVDPSEALSIGQSEITQGNSDLGDKVSKIVSRGEPIIRAYFMKIKQEYYDEDQATKEKVNARVDEALSGNEAGGAVEKSYGPGVTYSK
jgi:hypothetical protein